MPKPIKKPVKKVQPSGPPRLVVVELLDRTPAADGRTVIARRRTVLETSTGQLVQEWSQCKGYRVQIVERATPEGPQFVNAHSNTFKGVQSCQNSSSAVTSDPSGSPTSPAESRSPSPATTVPRRPAPTSSTSKARPSAKSPTPSSKPSSPPKKANPPRPSSPTKAPSKSAPKVAERSSRSSTAASRPTTSQRSVGSSTASSGKSGSGDSTKKPTTAKQPSKAVKATEPKKSAPSTATAVGKKATSKTQQTKVEPVPAQRVSFGGLK